MTQPRHGHHQPEGRPMATCPANVVDFLLARITEDEEAARLCQEMFPPPWDVADRGWRVRIYAADVPTEDLTSDDPEAMTTRNPVVMEVEPDRHIRDPRWLSERVEHVRRHDPARVLAECQAKRRILGQHPHELNADDTVRRCSTCGREGRCLTVRAMAAVYADHPDYDPAWRP